MFKRMNRTQGGTENAAKVPVQDPAVACGEDMELCFDELESVSGGGNLSRLPKSLRSNQPAAPADPYANMRASLQDCLTYINGNKNANQSTVDYFNLGCDLYFAGTNSCPYCNQNVAGLTSEEFQLHVSQAHITWWDECPC